MQTRDDLLMDLARAITIYEQRNGKPPDVLLLSKREAALMAQGLQPCNDGEDNQVRKNYFCGIPIRVAGSPEVQGVPKSREIQALVKEIDDADLNGEFNQ